MLSSYHIFNFIHWQIQSFESWICCQINYQSSKDKDGISSKICNQKFWIIVKIIYWRVFATVWLWLDLFYKFVISTQKHKRGYQKSCQCKKKLSAKKYCEIGVPYLWGTLGQWDILLLNFTSIRFTNFI